MLLALWFAYGDENTWAGIFNDAACYRPIFRPRRR